MSSVRPNPTPHTDALDDPSPAPVRPRGHLRDDVGLLILRLGLAAVMLAHGLQKVFGAGGLAATQQSFGAMGIPYSQLSATLLAVLELAGGVAILFGVLTTLVGLIYAAAMAAAIWYVHLPHGFFVAQGGYELAGLLGAASLALAVGGAGRLSLDRAIFGAARRRRIREARESAA